MKAYSQRTSYGDGIEAMKDSVSDASKNITCFEFKALAQKNNHKLVETHQSSKILDLKEIMPITNQNKNCNEAFKTAALIADASIDCRKDQNIKINSLAPTARGMGTKSIELIQKQIQLGISALSEFLFRGICLQISK
jgi:hypothetical protein